MKQIDDVLGLIDERVVREVFVEGAGVEVVTRRFYAHPTGRRPDKRQVAAISSRLKSSLSLLAGI